MIRERTGDLKQTSHDIVNSGSSITSVHIPFFACLPSRLDADLK